MVGSLNPVEMQSIPHLVKKHQAVIMSHGWHSSMETIQTEAWPNDPEHILQIFDCFIMEGHTHTTDSFI